MATEYVPYVGPVVTRAAARASESTRFFTGKVCKHGHLSQRTTANGGCIQCNAITGAALYRDEGRAARLERNAKNKAWKAANPDKIKAAGRKYSQEHHEQANAWKAANREKINAAERESRRLNPEVHAERARRYHSSPHGKIRDQAYYAANVAAIKQRAREWKLANPDRVLELRLADYETNKDVIKQRVRDWNEANPDGSRVRGRNYRARKFQAEGHHTRHEIEALYAKQGGRCVYCTKALGKKYEADHIQPLARGGSNWIGNIQLTCKPCNNRKRATDPIEYARRIGLLL